MITDPRGLIVDRLITVLASAGVTVFDGETPASVDQSKPWIVVELPAGGGHIPSFCPGQTWQLAVRLRAVAVDPDPAAGTGWTSARQAAQWATAKTVTVMLDAATPVTVPGWIVTARELVSDGGVDREGTTVNQVVDWVLTVSPS